MTLSITGEAFGLTDAGALLGSGPASRRNYSPARLGHIAEATELWGRTWDGDERAAIAVKEALASSDLFRSVTGDVLDRETLARYTELPAQWTQWARRTTVRNFKPKKLVDLLGGRTALDLVPELTEYPETEHDAREYEISVDKFGRRFGFSWEAGINDDLDELRTIPDAFAQAARITEDTVSNALLVTSAGAPNPAFFNAGNGNAPVAAVLNQENLTAAYTAVSLRTDSDGELVVPDQMILVVGPAQEIQARALLNATEIRTTAGSRTTLEPNPLRGMFTLVVNKRLKGTAWFLLPAPASGRPAFVVAFLTGHETPDLRVQNLTGNRVGGGNVDPSEGSFNEDAIYYRVRHVVGAATVDPIHTYAATGVAA